MIHLDIGGSSADRTLACPGWINASENVPKRPAGQAAVDGSMHHEVMELCQKTDTEPSDHLGLVYEENGVSRTFGEDDLDLSYIAFNATNKILDELDIELMEIEPFVQIIPDVAGGSIDMLGLSADGKSLMILDYKFGQGKVEIVDNKQLQFYAVASRIDPLTADLFAKVKKLHYVIIQPKLKGTVFTWASTPKELDVFQIKLMGAIEHVVNSANPPVNPGSHCKWCPASPYCKTRRADIVGAKSLGARVKEELQAGADIIEEVEDWLNSIKQELYVQIMRGVAIKGWKIVDKQASRKWIDADEAKKALLKANIDPSVFTKTALLSAPQTVDALKKAKIEFDLSDFIEVKSSGTTLAPEHHDGEAVTPGAPENLKKLMAKKAPKS